MSRCLPPLPAPHTTRKKQNISKTKHPGTLRRGRRKRARLDGQLPEAAAAWTFPCAQPGMISNLLFINQKGDVVISRTYREGASQKVIEMFRHQARACACIASGPEAVLCVARDAGSLPLSERRRDPLPRR